MSHEFTIEQVRAADPKSGDSSIEVCLAGGISRQYNSREELVARAKELHDSAELAEQALLAMAYALDPTLTHVELLIGKRVVLDWAALAAAVIP